MKDFRIYYDEKSDVLYLGKEGIEEEVVEVSPGLNIELDENDKIIGVEILHASRQLKDVIPSIGKRISACFLSRHPSHATEKVQGAREGL